MPPKRKFDKKTAQKFTVVNRSIEDPLYYDNEASQNVLVLVDNLNSKENKDIRKNKYKKQPITFTNQDAEEFKKQGIRDNEGEAANYGIFFDDTKYDYMQHLKPIGASDAVFISKRDQEKKDKKHTGLLLNPEYAVANNVNLPKELLPSEEVIKRTYQDQQNIPDAIAGFQPDMDPALREILEALDDEEYIGDEEEDDDLFNELLKGGEADSDDDNDYYDEDYDYYSDDGSVSSVKAKGHNVKPEILPYIPPTSNKDEPEEDWEAAFRQFKIDQAKSKAAAGYDTDSEAEDEVASLSVVAKGTKKNKGKKKNKFGGPGTEMTGLSMSSSANFRNAGLALLDDRFDTIEEEYADDNVEENHEAFDITKERPDLESILDDFLDNYAVEGKRLIRK